MQTCNDCTRKGCRHGACINMNKFDPKPIGYRDGHTCPQCGTYNAVWEKREKTVKKDIVYCWHCGCKVQLN